MGILTIERPPAVSDVVSRKAASSGRLDSLTGLRWFAALLIFLYHFSYEDDFYGAAKQIEWMRHYFFGGPTAVSFFFVLSGFVLAWTLRSNDTKIGFWRRRFARIYPSHLVTFFAALVLLPWLGQVFSWRAAIANLTLTQAWVPNEDEIWFGFNGVSWSLACEFFFYFMFPFLALWLKRFSVRGWSIVGGLACLFIMALPFASSVFSTELGWGPKYVIYVLPVLRLPDFILGICLAFIVKSGRWRGPGLLISLAFCAIALFWDESDVPSDFHWAAATVDSVRHADRRRCLRGYAWQGLGLPEQVHRVSGRDLVLFLHGARDGDLPGELCDGEGPPHRYGPEPDRRLLRRARRSRVAPRVRGEARGEAAFQVAQAEPEVAKNGTRGGRGNRKGLRRYLGTGQGGGC